ncbi:MAG TPA: CDP-2,3-bis-(O-geranylgeranyl)-sn-glycerol synthase [Methanoregulaceae archaeon]|nr:CDP-2,3-bis-(O-geranylgeranyl)-sn-glycerol synthase [Methanoregulaceae archaeon]HPD76028.1 CDP-2,3-bis-(O-geranylgeranyl)-sn-glycerol synthase [Methanoregulaceae archaeon]
MLPAYVPNPVAAIFGGGTPIDLGRKAGDGRRILGDGKTYRGLLAGVFSGLLVGFAEIVCSGAGLPGWLPVPTVSTILALALGALLGDIAKSFFKRRFGKERGEKWFLADQYDLVFGSLLLLALLSPGWFIAYITLPVLVAILIITPILHRAANIIGYSLGVKDVPW